MDIEAYERREQSAAKHLMLERYLEVLALKVGNLRRDLTLNYVDGFSGPWESQTDDLRDTSPFLALQKLTEVREKLIAAGGRLTVRAFFVSLDAAGAQRLRGLQARFPEAEVEVVVGSFEQHIDTARRFVQVGSDPFAFLFIDPTGWTGFGLKAISPLLREGRGEVLLNFMTGHIGRFVDSEDTELVPSFVDLFGDASYRDAWRGLEGLDREDRVVETYCQRVAAAGGYRHCVSSVVLKPTADRTHFHLVYATRSDEGLVAFREIERRGIELQREQRAKAQQRTRVDRSGQGELFGAPQLVARAYEDELRDRYLPRAIGVLDDMLRDRGEVSWNELVVAALRVPMVAEGDVKQWLESRRTQRAVEVLGLGPRERVPKRKPGYRVRRVR